MESKKENTVNIAAAFNTVLNILESSQNAGEAGELFVQKYGQKGGFDKKMSVLERITQNVVNDRNKVREAVMVLLALTANCRHAERSGLLNQALTEQNIGQELEKEFFGTSG